MEILITTVVKLAAVESISMDWFEISSLSFFELHKPEPRNYKSKL